MSAQALLARYASDSLAFAGTRLYRPSIARRLLADATTNRLAVRDAFFVRYDGATFDQVPIVLTDAEPGSTWMQVVFHRNSALWTALEAADAADNIAVAFIERESYFSGAKEPRLGLDEALRRHGYGDVRRIGGGIDAGLFEATLRGRRVLVTVGRRLDEDQRTLRDRLCVAPVAALALIDAGQLDGGRSYFVEGLATDAQRLFVPDALVAEVPALLAGVGRSVLGWHRHGQLAGGIRADMIFFFAGRKLELAGYTTRQTPFFVMRGDGPAAVFDDVYLAPELLDGAAASQATDTWAYAASALHLLDGRHPFGAGAMGAVAIARGDGPRSAYAGPARELLRAALLRDPAHRPPLQMVVDALSVEGT
ncbi:MAG: hypothetical protein ABI321_24200 [Polyangia bacterium]